MSGEFKFLSYITNPLQTWLYDAWKKMVTSFFWKKEEKKESEEENEKDIYWNEIVDKNFDKVLADIVKPEQEKIKKNTEKFSSLETDYLAYDNKIKETESSLWEEWTVLNNNLEMEYKDKEKDNNYWYKKNEIYKNAWLIDNVKKIDELNQSYNLKLYSIALDEDVDTLKKIVETQWTEWLLNFAQKKTWLDRKQVQKKIWEKVEAVYADTQKLRETSNRTLQKKKIKSLDSVAAIFSGIFSDIWLPRTEQKETRFLKSAFDVDKTWLQPEQEWLFNSIVSADLRWITKSLKWTAFNINDGKREAPENFQNRFFEFINTDTYKNYINIQKELIKRPEFWEWWDFNEAKYNVILRETPQRKAYNADLKSKEKQLKVGAIWTRTDVFWDEVVAWWPLAWLQSWLASYWADVAMSEKKQAEKELEGFDIDELLEWVEYKEWFLDYATKNKKWYAAPARLLASMVSTPYKQLWMSEASKEQQKQLLRADEEYSQNAYFKAVEAILTVWDFIAWEPEDKLLAVSTMWLGNILKAGGTYLKWWARLAPKTQEIFNWLQKLTIANPNSKIWRGLTDKVYKWLKNLVDAQWLPIDWYFITKFGFEPERDIWVPMWIPFLWYLWNAYRFGKKALWYKVTENLLDKIFDINKSVLKEVDKDSPEFLEKMKDELFKESLFFKDIPTTVYTDPVKLSSEIQSRLVEWARDPKLFYQAMSADLLAREMTKPWKENMLKDMKDWIVRNEPERAKQFWTIADEEVISSYLKASWATKLDNMYKYWFIKHEFNLSKWVNPIFDNINNMFTKLEDFVKNSAKDETVKGYMIDTLNEAKSSMIVSQYWMLNNGAVWWKWKLNEASSKMFKKIRELWWEEFANEIIGVAKTENISKSVDDYFKIVNEKTPLNVEDARKIWNSLSNQEKENIFDATRRYILDSSVSKEDKKLFLKDLWINDDDAFMIMNAKEWTDIYSKSMNIVLDSLWNRFKNWMFEMSASEFSKWTDALYEAGVFTKTTKAKDRLWLLRKAVNWVDEWAVTYWILDEKTRGAFRKIAPYLNLNSIDRKNVVLNQLANSALLDNVLNIIKKWWDVSKKNIKSLVDNIVKWFWDKLFGSLDVKIKNWLISDYYKFLKKNWKKLEWNIEDVLAREFENSFIDLVYWKADDIANSMDNLWKKISSKEEKFVEKFRNKIDEIIESYVSATEETSKMINDIEDWKWAVEATAYLLKWEINLDQTRKAVDNAPITRVMNSWIDMPWAITITSKEWLLKKIGEVETADELSKYITRWRYDDDYQKSIITSVLWEKEWKKFIDAIELAKQRRFQAANLLAEFRQQAKDWVIPAVIEYKWKKISLQSVLENLDYKITSNWLINTLAHDIPKIWMQYDQETFMKKMEYFYNTYMRDKDQKVLNEILSSSPELWGNYVKLVQNVYERIKWIAGEIDDASWLAADVTSRMVVGMPQYIDDIIEMWDKITLDDIVFTLLDANKRNAKWGFWQIYENMINKLGDVSSVDTKTPTFLLSKNDNLIKNAQLVYMDWLIKSSLTDWLKIPDEAFFDIIAKNMIDSSQTLASKHIPEILQWALKWDVDWVLLKNLPEFWGSSSVDELVSDAIDYINRKEVKKFLGEDYDNVLKQLEEWRKWTPEKYKKLEYDKIMENYNSIPPSTTSLDSFGDDVINAEKITRDLSDNVADVIRNWVKKITIADWKIKKWLIDSKMLSNDAVKSINDEKEYFYNWLKKLFDINKDWTTIKEFFDTIEWVGGFEEVMKMNPEDAMRIMYDNWLSKKVFEFKWDWYKSVVIDKADSYRKAGEIMLYDDYNYNKRYVQPFKLFSKLASTLQSFGKNSQEWTAIMEKSYRARWAQIVNKEYWYLHDAINILYPWENVWKRIYFWTFINKAKDIMQKWIKDWKLTREQLIKEFELVAREVLRKWKKWESVINSDFRRMIAWYIEWVNSVRKWFWLSQFCLWEWWVLDTTFDEFIKNWALGWVRKNSVQWALDSLEWLNWFWLWLDVADYKRIKELAWGVVGEDSIRRFLFNSYARSLAWYKFEKVFKFLESAEHLGSSLMYGYLFNPVTWRPLWTQQVLQNMNHLKSKQLLELANIKDDYLEWFLDILDNTKEFKFVDAQINQNLLVDPLQHGRWLFYRALKTPMAISVQNISDRIFLNQVKRNAIASAFLEYWYTPESVWKVFESISAIWKMLDWDLKWLTDLRKVIYSDPERLKYAIMKRWQELWIENTEEIVNKLLKEKENIGNIWEVLNNSYMKIGAFYQFSNIPQIAGSWLSTRRGSFAFLKFMNRASKKAGEYSTDLAYHLARKDWEWVLWVLTSIATEALYVWKTYSMLDRITRQDGKSQLDAWAFWMAAWTPAIVMNMVFVNAGEAILRAKRNKDRHWEYMPWLDSWLSFSKLLEWAWQFAMDKMWVTPAFVYNVGMSMYMTKKEVEKIVPPTEWAMWWYLAWIYWDAIKDSFWSRWASKSVQRFWWQYFDIPWGNAWSLFADNIMWMPVSKPTLNARDDARWFNTQLFWDKDEDWNLEITMAYSSPQPRVVNRINHQFAVDNWLYNWIAWTNIPEMLYKFEWLSKNKWILDAEKKAWTYQAQDDFLAEADIKTDNSAYVFKKVTNSLMWYNPSTNKLDFVAEKTFNLKDVKDLSKEIVNWLRDDKSAGAFKKMIKSDAIEQQTKKLKSNVWEAVYFWIKLNAISSNYEKTIKEEVIEEYIREKSYDKERLQDRRISGINRKIFDKIKEDADTAEITRRTKAKVEKFQMELIAENYESIKALNADIPVDFYQSHRDLLNQTAELKWFRNKSRWQTEWKNVLWAVLRNQWIEAFGTNNMYSYAFWRLLNTAAKEEDKEKRASMVSDIKNSLKAVSVDFNWSNFSKWILIGITSALTDNITKLPELAEDEEIMQMCIDYSNTISTSWPISDEWIKEEIRSAYITPWTWWWKSNPKIKMLEDKLNKFQRMADEARMIKYGSLPNTKTSFSSSSDWGYPSIRPITVVRPPEEKIITDYKYFTPPPQIKEPELEVKPTSVKTVKSKSYKPKAIKTVKKSFKRS